MFNNHSPLLASPIPLVDILVKQKPPVCHPSKHNTDGEEEESRANLPRPHDPRGADRQDDVKPGIGKRCSMLLSQRTHANVIFLVSPSEDA